MRRAAQIILMVALVLGTSMAAQADPRSDAAVDERTRDALVAALDDERRAQALYGAIMERFGRVRPFVNIAEAEVRHERALLALFEAYGVTVPARRMWRIDVPETLREACVMGVQSERQNIAMYDGFLGFVRESDIRATFTRLRDASRDRHEPAFERCVRAHGG